MLSTMASGTIYGAVDRIEADGERSDVINVKIPTDSVAGNWSNPKTILLTIFMLIGATIGCLMAYYGGNRPQVLFTFSNIIMPSFSESMVEHKLLFTMKRLGYGPLDFFDPEKVVPHLKYRFLNRFDGIVEPYTANTLHIFSDADAKEVSYYRYDICSSNNECVSGALSASSSTALKTSTVTVECNPMDEYTIMIHKLGSDHRCLGYEKGSLVCMYVRREMRELTEKDLSDTLDTMKILYEVNEKTGQQVYGSEYHDMDYLMGFHFFNAAMQDGDHIHEGLGFLPQHLKITNVFEKALRVVNPSISLPYWDYTIEDAQGTNVWESFMFTEKTFGSMPTPPDTTWGWLYKNSKIDDARIPNGRWKDQTTGININYPDMKYAYGYMRAPWSMNPSKYITRFTSVDKALPTCQSFYTLASYTDLYSVLTTSPNSPHASTHGAIGGVYGCDAFDDLTARGLIFNDAAQITLCKYWLFYMKEFYRRGVFNPKAECSYNEEDSSQSTCGFECDPDMRERIEQLIVERDFINDKASVAPTNWNEASVNAWIDFICTGDGYKNFGGDHLEAASAADPSFWPIHPNMERLIQARYMVGGWPEFDWPTTAHTDDYVCAKQECFHASNKSTYVDDSCCAGHYADSRMMVYNGGIDYVGPTNVEQMKMIDPRSEEYGLSYIYSNFDWSHCLSNGVDIAALLESLYQPTFEG